MEYKEFGQQNKPVILLIHGFCMPLSMWDAQIDALRKDYHVIAVVLDGHEGKKSSNFQSVEYSAKQIIEYLENRNYKEIFAICGFSLGGAIAISIIASDKLFIKKAIIDAGITPSHISNARESFIVHRDLFATMLARKNQKLLEIKFSQKYYSKTFINQFYCLLQSVSNVTVKNVYYSVDTYSLPEDLSHVNTEIQYWYGTKEKKEREKDANFVKSMFRNIRICTFKGYRHGQLCIGNPQLYLKSAFDFFDKPKDLSGV